MSYPHTNLEFRRERPSSDNVPTNAEAQSIADDILVMAAMDRVILLEHLERRYDFRSDCLGQILLDLLMVGILAETREGSCRDFVKGPSFNINLLGEDWYRIGTDMFSGPTFSIPMSFAAQTAMAVSHA